MPTSPLELEASTERSFGRRFRAFRRRFVDYKVGLEPGLEGLQQILAHHFIVLVVGGHPPTILSPP